MKTARLALLAGAALVAVSSVQAHNPLAHPDWCMEGGRMVIVDEFRWSGEEMERLARREDGGSCPAGGEAPDAGGVRTCGQFDDDWLQAFRMCSAHCDQFRVNFESAYHRDHGTVVPIVTSPEEFLDPEHHHELYFLGLGLGGACVRCEPDPVRPVRPTGR